MEMVVELLREGRWQVAIGIAEATGKALAKAALEVISREPETRSFGLPGLTGRLAGPY